MKTKFILVAIFTVLLNNFNLLFSGVLEINTLNNPAPGYLNFSVGLINHRAIALYDNYGDPHYEKGPFLGGMQKLLSDNNWYIFSQPTNKIFVLNDNLEVLDSLIIPSLGDTVNFDNHDMMLLPNGKYLIAMVHITKMDLSQIIEGGHTDANVVGAKLLQIDKLGNIYWSWDCFDYLDITEVTRDIDLTQVTVDFTHFNSFALDLDGNILVSFRHLDQILKIDKNNGNIIWRLGSCTAHMNDFRFLNDTINGFIGFSHQHSIEILPNGNLIMFDNGNLKEPLFSRAVEYSLDQTNFSITKVWEYRKIPDIYASAMGNAQRLQNGNTLINWANSSVQEIKPNGNIALDVSIESIYRAIKVQKNMDAVILSVTNNGQYSFNNQNQSTNVTLEIQSKNGTGLTWVEKHYYQPPTVPMSIPDYSSVLPYRWVIRSDGVLSVAGKIILKISNLDGISSPNKLTIYKRNNETTGNFSALLTTYNSSSQELSANFNGFGEFIICSNVLAIPTLSFPLNYCSGNNIIDKVVWNKLIGATAYRLQIALDSNFSNLVQDSIVLQDTTTCYKELEYNKIYYWRIRGINSKDTSQWSAIWSFKTKIPPPKLLSPGNDKFGVKLNEKLIWEDCGTNAKYFLQLSENKDFSDTIENKLNLNTNFYISSLLKNNKKYFLRLALIKGTDTSDWSKPYNFTTIMQKPYLFTPKNDSINVLNPVKLEWIQVEGATSYNVEFSDNENFNGNFTQKMNIPGTYIEINSLKYSKRYYWRVQAKRSTDSSDFSDIFSFYTLLSKLTLISPNNKDTGLVADFNFSWDNIEGDANFQIQIAKDSLFNLVIEDLNSVNSNCTIYELPGFSRLYWRVKYYIGKKYSDWSEISYFNTGKGIKIESPKLYTPRDKALNQNISGAFDWSSVNKANKYRIQVSEDTEFKKIIIDSNNIIVNSCLYSDFDYSSKYYWHVLSYSKYDSSSWSGIWWMQTMEKPDLVAITLQKPQYDALQVKVIDTLIWKKVNNSICYQIQVSEDIKFSYLTISEENYTSNRYIYDNLKKNKVYYWRIRYISTKDTSEWSDIWEFMTETDNILAVPQLLHPINYIFAVPVKGKLEWDEVKNATSYKVSLSKSETFFPRVINVSWHKELFLNYDNLDYNTIYFWRVAGQNDNSLSPWSVTKQFVTELKPVESVFPKNNDKEVPPNGTLSWERINGAINYQILLSDDINFENYLISDTLNDTLCSYTLQDERQYFWKIKAFNIENESRWSELFTFTIPKSTSVEYDNETDFVIYPNPAADFIYIKFSTNLISIDKIDLMDYLGNIYFSSTVNDLNSHSGIFRLDISNVNNGLYFLLISNKTGIKKMKIIISK